MPQFKDGMVSIMERFERSPLLQRVVTYCGLRQEGKKFEAAMVLGYLRFDMGLPQSFQRQRLEEALGHRELQESDRALALERSERGY